MEQWQTIGDDEVATFGKRSIIFGFPGGTYQVDIDDEEQNSIYARHSGQELCWHIYVKEVHGETFRLQGLASRTDGLFDDTFWYVLTLTLPATVTYWGDRVLAREDREV